VWLREPIDCGIARRLSVQRRYCGALPHILVLTLSAAEPNPVLRVVKTFNHKPHYSPAKRVELEVFEPSRTYNPDHFDQILP
jgi:hypothetical protein